MKQLQRATAILCLAISLGTLSLPVPKAFAATDTFSPSIDGRFLASNASWATVRAASASTSVNTTANIMNVTSQEAGNYFLYRAMIITDTSSLPDTDVTSAATFRFTPDRVINGGEAYSYVVLTGPATPASDASFATDDFDQCGTTEMSDHKALSGLSVGTSFTFTLNAAGLANISTTGKSRWCVRMGNDVENVAPGSSIENNTDLRTQDHATSGDRPLLSVTHAAPASAPATPKHYFWIMYHSKPEPFFDFA